MKRKLVCVGIVFLVSIVAFLLFSPSAADAAREKKKIVVIPFTDSTGNNLADLTTKMVGSTLINLKYLDARQLVTQSSGLIDDNAAIDMGKKAKANVLIMGTLSKASFNEAQTVCIVVGANAGKYPCIQVGRWATISVRIIDIDKGKVAFSGDLGSDPEHPGGGAAFAASYKQGDPRPAPELIFGDAIDVACNQLYRKVQEVYPLMGKVVKKEERIITVDAGKEFGVKMTRAVEIYSAKAKPILDPNTGEVVGYGESDLVAKGHVHSADADTCEIKLSKKDMDSVQEGDIVLFKPEKIGKGSAAPFHL